VHGGMHANSTGARGKELHRKGAGMPKKKGPMTATTQQCKPVKKKQKGKKDVPKENRRQSTRE